MEGADLALCSGEESDDEPSLYLESVLAAEPMRRCCSPGDGEGEGTARPLANCTAASALGARDGPEKARGGLAHAACSRIAAAVRGLSLGSPGAVEGGLSSIVRATPLERHPAHASSVFFTFAVSSEMANDLLR